VAEAKRRLALQFNEDKRVDVALATNMISVGLDIMRLGLMVVLGQPKTTAEYIQATSRVGRDDEKPGLVVTLLNIHRPRDRSHYERFEAYHASFYRAVEATSVTPFAPRAIDRAVSGVTVALARHGDAALTPALGAVSVVAERPKLDFVAKAMADRAEGHDPTLSGREAEALRTKVKGAVQDVLDSWGKIAFEKQNVGSGLKYNQYEGAGAPHLLYDPLDAALETQPAIFRKFRTQRSMRDVEPSVGLYVRRTDGVEVPEEDEE
jgi:hypothetical protein